MVYETARQCEFESYDCSFQSPFFHTIVFGTEMIRNGTNTSTNTQEPNSIAFELKDYDFAAD